MSSEALARPDDTALAQLFARAKDYAQASKAPRTLEAYLDVWRAFETWCTAHHVPALPSSDAVVASYLAHLADAGRAYSTIQQAYAGIVFAQRAQGVNWPKGAPPACRTTLQGIARTLGTAPKQKSPITDTELRSFLDALKEAGKAEGLIGLRDRALLLVGFFGAFRRSELAAMQVAHLTFQPEGLVIRVPRSKTDQAGAGKTKGLPFAGNPSLCPARALQAWLEASKVGEGPVFRAMRYGRPGAALGGAAIARVVKRAAAAAGVDVSLFSGHSLRAGFVTTAAKRGKSLDAIMRQTGHSDVKTVRGYIRHATLFDDNAAGGLL